MDLSVFVAQLFAVAYLSIGLGFLFSKNYYKKLLDSFLKEPASIYMGGMVALIAGFSLVTFHNDWVNSWEVLVTIFGWLALVKGVLLLAFPNAMVSMTKKWFTPKRLHGWSLIVILIGLVFGYFGFVV